jgi:peptidoglycan/xylan/chitin deacetylase (PgdA/CDA1 family)
VGIRFVAVLCFSFSLWVTATVNCAFCMGTASKVPSGQRDEAPQFRSDSVVVYVVKEGDRLTELASRFYGDPEKGWLIEEANDLVELEPGQVLVVPLQPTNPGGLSPSGYQVVPVITYHHFSTQCKNLLCLPIDEFSRQMAFLKEQGYRTVTMKQLLRFITYQEPLPRKAVAITIDDGYRSVYEKAYPILKKHNFKATLFIYTAFIGNSPNAMTWEQLREMSEDGFEVESHTISHADLTRKQKGESEVEYRQRIRRELQEPRALIRKHLGQEAVWLAYPYGRLNGLIITMAREAGYRGGVTVIRGSNPFFSDPFKVRRYQVMNPKKGSPFEEMVMVFHGEVLQ